MSRAGIERSSSNSANGIKERLVIRNLERKDAVLVNLPVHLEFCFKKTANVLLQDDLSRGKRRFEQLQGYSGKTPCLF